MARESNCITNVQNTVNVSGGGEGNADLSHFEINSVCKTKSKKTAYQHHTLVDKVGSHGYTG